MLNFLSRHRTGFVFLSALVFLLSTIAAQISEEEHTSMLGWAVYSITSPFQQAFSYVFVGAGDFWDEYVSLQEVRRENEVLRVRLSDQIQENQVLQERLALVGSELDLDAFGKIYINAFNEEGIKGYIIGAGLEGGQDTIIINKGSLHGVETEMGVICPTGIVGKVVRVSPGSSIVQLVTDRRFAMAARLQGSRVRGIVRGATEGELSMDYIRDTDSVSVGDRVVSSGLEQIFPRGILVGRVSKVEAGRPPLQKVTVSPSTNVRSLEWVLIVEWQEEATDN